MTGVELHARPRVDDQGASVCQNVAQFFSADFPGLGTGLHQRCLLDIDGLSGGGNLLPKGQNKYCGYEPGEMSDPLASSLLTKTSPTLLFLGTTLARYSLRRNNLLTLQNEARTGDDASNNAISRARRHF